MKRRDFLKKAGIGAAAAAAGAAGIAGLVGCAKEEEEKKEVAAPAVVTKKTYKWRMTTTWPPKLPVLQEGADRIAKRIKEMSGGRLEIQVFAGGELVPPFETFQAVSDGTVECGTGAAYYWAGKEPACQWFAAVPFGMNAQGMAAWFHSGDGLRLWEGA